MIQKQKLKEIEKLFFTPIILSTDDMDRFVKKKKSRT